MQIKRFFAQDTAKALAQVRAELGPDAMIITNRKVEDGVEIIASAYYDESAIETHQAATRPASETAATGVTKTTHAETQAPSGIASRGATAAQPSQQNTTKSTAMGAGAYAPGKTADTGVAAMREEIEQLRGLLDTQISAMKVGQWGQQNPMRTELFNKLSLIGLGADMITQLLESCSIDDDLPSASRKVLLALKDAINISEQAVLDEPGVAVLIGPTGAGKTTTIAKLAAQLLRQHDPREIILVCADRCVDQGRIGAHEQLATLGQLLGVSVLRARDSMELEQMLIGLGPSKRVLVDCAGLSQADLRDPMRLPLMNTSVTHVRHYLVIPATMQRAALGRILQAMQTQPIEGVILSKIDEAMHLGDVLSCLYQYPKPLVYWADGQRIAKDLQRADAGVLVSKAMQLSQSPDERRDEQLMMTLLHSTRPSAANPPPAATPMQASPAPPAPQQPQPWQEPHWLRDRQVSGS